MTAPKRDEPEEHLLKKIQVWASVAFLILIVLQFIIDSLGRLFIDPSFHVNEVLFATTVGAFLGLVGVTIIKPPWSKE